MGVALDIGSKVAKGEMKWGWDGRRSRSDARTEARRTGAVAIGSSRSRRRADPSWRSAFLRMLLASNELDVSRI